ncbi:MAG: cell division protein FtsB [Gammaproteobacteria bacterium]|nr:cell division protein FtsB [Gammaproteobacteria bacterium]
MGIGLKLVIAAFLLLTVALQVRLWGTDGGLGSVNQLERLVDRQRLDNQKMAERNRLLMAEVEDLRRGKDAIEERARSELGMIGEGEQFYLAIERRQ